MVVASVLEALVAVVVLVLVASLELWASLALIALVEPLESLDAALVSDPASLVLSGAVDEPSLAPDPPLSSAHASSEPSPRRRVHEHRRATLDTR